MATDREAFYVGLLADVEARLIVQREAAKIEGPISWVCMKCGAYPSAPCVGKRNGRLHRVRKKAFRRYVSGV